MVRFLLLTVLLVLVITWWRRRVSDWMVWTFAGSLLVLNSISALLTLPADTTYSGVHYVWIAFGLLAGVAMIVRPFVRSRQP